MRKLSNNDPGFLKHKFEDESSFASLKSWKALEDELIVLNAAQRKRKRRAFIMWFSSSAAVIGFALMALFQTASNTYNYLPRTFTFSGFEIESNDGLQSRKNHELGMLDSRFEAYKPQHVSSISTQGTVVLKTEFSNKQETEVQTSAARETELQLATILPKEIPLGSGEMISESFDMDFKLSKPKSAKWRFQMQGGLDDTRHVLAAKNAVIGDPSAGNSSRQWDFNNYTYQRPIALNLSIERRILNRLYIRAGWDYKHMRSVALAEPFKNRTAIKRGNLDHVGMNMGASYSLITHKRLSLDLIGEVSLAHVKNSFTRVEEFNEGEFVRSYEIERTTPSSILSLGAQARLNYRIAGHWKLTAAVVSLKPIHNYIDELNVYNNGFKYIHGARLGLSFEI